MRSRLQKLSLAGLSLALILALQIIGLPNLVTGIAVNAIFVFMVGYSGSRPALLVGLLSPVGGFFSGHLSAIMYPIIPVIMAGNLIFILIYSGLKIKSWFPRFLLPALAKAIFIFALGMALINWLDIAGQVKWLIVPVLGIQFFTALAGIFLGEKLLGQVPCEP